MNREGYWQHKLSVFLHDPAHKALSIQRHEELAADIATLLHQSMPQKQDYTTADRIASSLSRAALPGYSKDDTQSGAIDFAPNPVLTHPLVSGASLSALLDKLDIKEVHQAVRTVLAKDVGLGLSAEELNSARTSPGATVPLSANFSYSNDPDGWSKALYHYLFFAFKKRLRAHNVGGIGALWDLMPADTRMPDHPLWHHCGLTSAIASSMASDPNGQVGVAVFSITPVQSFITKARKLRDHWVGSVILSYLAFVGIRHIARNLGPDHVLYPSLHDQSLVDAWLAQEFHMEDFLREPDPDARKHLENSTDIASFPNKFVFLAPNFQMTDICQGIRDAIQGEWLQLAFAVRDILAPRSDGRKMRALFDHQISDYWQLRDASMRLAGLDDTEALSSILHPEKWKAEHETVKGFAASFHKGELYARLYSATHSAVQSLLASSKLKPETPRKAQEGEKCPLCGEHEVLHDFHQAGSTNAKEYKSAVTAFWDSLRQRMNSADSFAQVGKNERLCAVCCIKRFLPRALTNQPTELLHSVLAKADVFQSTTEMAAHSYLNDLGLKGKERRKFADKLHNIEIGHNDADQDDVGRSERDNYYAALVMDGDKMGDLVNGKTLTATWGDVIHPNLRKRFVRADFDKSSPLKKRLCEKRTLNPSLHATISDSLNSFGRFAVAPLVRGGSGRLIYAGGDDVCAIMPLDTVLQTADAIQRAYSMDFVRYTEHGPEPLQDKLTDLNGKWGIHLGKADGISISAAIVIAHHKTPLREVLRDAQNLLKSEAKEHAGRNALAISLSKRSGAPRKMTLRWTDTNLFMENSERVLESFQALMRDVNNDEVASRLLYRLESLRDALFPMMDKDEHVARNKEKIVHLFRYEVMHSGKMLIGDKERQKEAADIMARRLAGVCLQQKHDKTWVFRPEAAIVARFLAPQAVGGNR